jgi:hypothetical protein
MSLVSKNKGGTMGFGRTTVETIEHEGHCIVITNKRMPIVVDDDYQSMLAVCMEAIRTAYDAGKLGDFGIHFTVDTHKRTVKRAEKYWVAEIVDNNV